MGPSWKGSGSQDGQEVDPRMDRKWVPDKDEVNSRCTGSGFMRDRKRVSHTGVVGPGWTGSVSLRN